MALAYERWRLKPLLAYETTVGVGNHRWRRERHMTDSDTVQIVANVMPTEPRLPKWGYEVVDLDLDPTVIEQALSEARSKKYNPIFLEVGGPDGPNRLQSRVKHFSAALREIPSALQEFTRCASDNWSPGVASFLRSLPGGDFQAPHQDYSAEDIARAGERGIPGSAIVSLEPGTVVRVYPGCFREVDRRVEKLVSIPPGFAIIFRGDLIHSGASYTTINHRLFFYIEVGDKTWKPDHVTQVRPPGFFCGYQNCSVESESSPAILQHRLVCRFNPKCEENREKRRTRELGEFECELCTRQDITKKFKTAGGLCQHKISTHGK